MKKLARPPYRIVIDWDAEDAIFVARVPELRGVATHGDTEEEALEMAHEAIDLHLESLRAHDEEIPEAVAKQKISGKYPLRMSPDLHRRLLIEAIRKNMSLNEYLCFKLDDAEREQKSMPKLNQWLNKNQENSLASWKASKAQGMQSMIHKKTMKKTTTTKKKTANSRGA